MLIKSGPIKAGLITTAPITPAKLADYLLCSLVVRP